MSKKLTGMIWSPLAESQYVTIKEYLLRKFTQKEVNRLDSLLDEFHEIILKFPELYPKTKFKKDLSRAVLSRELSVFYRTKGVLVQIVAIYDNRLDYEPKLKN